MSTWSVIGQDVVLKGNVRDGSQQDIYRNLTGSTLVVTVLVDPQATGIATVQFGPHGPYVSNVNRMAITGVLRDGGTISVKAERASAVWEITAALPTHGAR